MTAAAETASVASGVAGKTPRRLFWERFSQDKAAIVAGVVVIVLILVAIGGGPLAAAVTGHGANDVSLQSQQTDLYGVPKGPNSTFILGADSEGRDLFVRVMYGARTSLFVGVAASLLALAIGLTVGLAAGFFGGWIDMLLSRAADVMLSLPQLVIGVGIVAACSTNKQGCVAGLIQPGIPVVIAVITFFSWSYIARLVRGYTLSLREKDFVEASRSLGAGSSRIVWREILPNLIGPMIVYTTLLIPQNIIFEAALDFLGLGVPSTTPSWGQVLSEWTQNGLYTTGWWLLVFPGLALVITTLAFNLLGDGLSDALDVRSDR